MSRQLLDEISTFLRENRTQLPVNSRGLLEAFHALGLPTGTARLPVKALRAELGRRQGKAVGEAGLRQRVKRLNDLLRKARATFEFKSGGGDLIAQPTHALDENRRQQKLQDALTGMSHERARVDAGGLVEPRATPESGVLLVFFSYAWLNEEEHKIQVEFYERLAEKLAYPPPEFAALPKIVMWRDTRNLAASKPGDPQMDAACRRSFLGLLMMSNKYPHSGACMREADFFLTADGENQIGKFCVVLGVNVPPRQIPKRFTAGTRVVQLGPKGQHLVAFWSSANAGDRTAFVDQIANEIFHAAEKSLASSGPDERSVKDAESFLQTMSVRATPREKMVESYARPGRVSLDIAASPSSDSKDGVPIVQHLIQWASGAEVDAPRLVALLGDFGMGKTVACQLFTQKLVELRAADPSLPVPVYFDLRDVDRVEGDGASNLEALIDQMLHKIGDETPSAKEVIRFVRERNAVVVFDGLDEVTNKLSPEAAIRLYRDLLSIVPSEFWIADAERRRQARSRGRRKDAFMGPRVLVSCRTHYFKDVSAQRGFLTGAERSRLDADADVAVYFMLPFTDRQIESCLRLNLGDDQADRALALIGETYNLRELAERPILLRFIRETFEQIERAKLAGKPVNLTRLYDIFVAQVFERDNPKHIIPLREKQLILQALSLHMHKRGLNELSNTNLDAWFQDYVRTAPRLSAALQGADGLKLSEIFAQDLRNASLLVRPGEKAFRFAHTSIREYFLASALYEAVRTGHGSSAWDSQPPTAETLTFLLQRHAAEDTPERSEFEARFARLMEQGQPAPVRWLAFELWAAAQRTDDRLPRPETIDLSALDFRRRVFAGTRGRLLPLHRSIWQSAALHQAEFSEVDLSGADFSGAEAPMSRWLRCHLVEVKFASNLRGSLWRNCEIPKGMLDQSKVLDMRAVGCTQSGERWCPQGAIAPETGRWRYRSNFMFADVVTVGRVDGRDVAVSGGIDEMIRVFDLVTGAQLLVLEGHKDSITSVVVGRVGGKDVVVSGSEDSSIRVFDLATGAELAVLEGHRGPVWSIALAHINGKDVAVSGGHDNTVCVFDLATGIQLAVLEGHKDSVASVAVAHVGGKDVAVSGCNDGVIRVFDLATGTQLAALEGHKDSVASVAIARVGGKDVAVSGGDDDTIRMFDLATGTQLAVLGGHEGRVASVAVARVGGKDVAVSTGGDSAIRIFDLATGAQLAVLEGHKGMVASAAVGRISGKDIVLFSNERTVHVFDLATGVQLAVLVGHQGAVTSIAVGRVGGKDVAVSGGHDSAMRVFDLATGAQLAVLQGHEGPVTSVAFGCIGGKDVVISGGNDSTIRMFDPATGRQLALLKGHKGAVGSVTVARVSGKDVVVSGSHDGTIRVFDPAREKRLAVLKGHEGRVGSVAVARVGGKDVVVSGGYDRTIRMFDLATGRQLTVLKAHKGAVTSVAVAHIGGKDVVISGGYDRRIRLFDLATGEQLAVLEVHEDWIMCLAAGRIDGKELVVSGSYDSTVCAATLASETFDCESILSINPATQSAIAVKVGQDGNQTLVLATSKAWRDWYAEYRVDGVIHTADIEEMPRAPAAQPLATRSGIS